MYEIFVNNHKSSYCFYDDEINARKHKQIELGSHIYVPDLDITFIAVGPGKWVLVGERKGIDLKTALHYLNGDKKQEKITAKVTNIIYGFNEEYPNIIAQYPGVLVDVEQDVQIYAYYVPNNNQYDIYLLGNDTIYSPKNSKKLYANMIALKTVDTHNYNVDRVTNMESLFDYCSSLVSVDTSAWNLSKVTTMAYAFYDCKNLAELDSTNWNLKNNRSLYMTFYGCSKLSKLDVSKWDTKNITTLYSTFFRCKALTSLDVSNWNTGSITTFGHAFTGCSNIQSLDVSKWNTKKATSLLQTFKECSKIETLDVSNWDVSNVVDMNWVFANCTNLNNINLNKWNTSNVNRMECLFFMCSNLTSLDLSKWNVSNVTSMAYMFAGCLNLQTLNIQNWSTSNLISIDSMFNECEKLTTINVSSLNTAKVKEFCRVFDACSNLTEIVGLDQWNTENGYTFFSMFNALPALRELDLSSFNTKNARDGYKILAGKTYNAFTDMFGGLNELSKLSLSENIKFNGNGSAANMILPNPATIEDQITMWYNENTNNYYSATEIPDETAATYTAAVPV